MQGLAGKWIWCPDAGEAENTAVCFRKAFTVASGAGTIVRISADTRYILYINGSEIGRGPARSTLDRWFYDEYDIGGDVSAGGNLLAVHVWDYGWSTYQSIANKGGLIFDVRRGDEVLAASDGTCRCAVDEGLVSKTVRRNVNLGFMENYDARRFPQGWMHADFDDSGWSFAAETADNWGTLEKRPVKYLDTRIARPEKVMKIREIIPRRNVVSVNTRNAFFPGRRDANATIMTGYIGAIIESAEDTEGIIAFPNNKWNGMHGDFRIEGKHYEAGKGDREKKVRLRKGPQLFLMELSAKFDDLFVHIEYEFDCTVAFCDFFAVGPVWFAENKTDGFSKIYGGLNDYDGYGVAPESKEAIFGCRTMEELLQYGDLVKEVDPSYIFHNEYIYSLVRNTGVLRDIPLTGGHNAILSGNCDALKVETPESGGCMEIILDFNDMFVGNIYFRLNAAAGTAMDIYCFENMFEGEIDYTFGLNNGMRYVCREGWQEYTTMSRIGLRYMMLVFRNMEGPVEIRDVLVNQRSYPVGRNGSFRCSDWQMNKIFEISRRTNLMCSEDTFADSPTYEQAFWSGDAQVSAAVSAFYFGEYELLRHCIMQVPLGRKYTELLPALMPTDWETAIPMWTMNWMISIEQYIFYTGDESVASDLYDEVRTTLEYYSGFIGEDGAFEISAWNMIDWAPMDIGNEGVVTAQHGLLAHCFRIAAKLASLAGRGGDIPFYERYERLLLSYMNENLWDGEKGGFIDGWTRENGPSKTISMQTNIMLELYGLISDVAKRESVLSRLLGPHEGWLEPGSPFMLFYLFEIWHRHGMDAGILREIKERWGMMLRYDSSTCWEVFPGFYENSRTRSYCHSWSSAPGYIFIKYFLGLTPTGRGFSEMELNIPDIGLEWCEGSIPTPFGMITIYWSKENGPLRYRARIPRGINIVERELRGFCPELEWY
ncbi:MAG: alpha-L-rhamnosidase N-terminal domain-containing protein [Clostridia bacterium]|nr:alpha-L-rhamnosidase N-terminal domain-containing protein [Clostridia bacterium]